LNLVFHKTIHALAVALLLFHAGDVAAADREALATNLLESRWNDPWGVFQVPLTPTLAADLKEKGTGSLLTAVAAESSAHRAGLKIGDVVRHWDVANDPRGVVRITYTRGGQVRNTTLTTGRHDLSKQKFVAPKQRSHAAPLIIDSAGHGDYQTITAGLISAGSGDTIEIHSGVYRERVTVPSGITLRRKPGDAVLWSFQTCPVLICGVNGVTLDGLSLAGHDDALRVLNSSHVTVRDCTLVADTDVIDCTNASKFRLKACRIRGSGKGRGLLLAGSKCELNACIVADCRTAVEAIKSSAVQCVGNLMEGNTNGIITVSSETKARGNSINGLGNGLGISVKQSQCELLENTIRNHECGVDVAQTNGTVTSNSLLQNNYGMWLRGGTLTAAGNVVVGNHQHGIFLGELAPRKDAGLTVVLERNTITNNGKVGIITANCQATIAFNFVGENGYGISLVSGTAELDHNTIVDNHLWGVQVAEQASASIANNVIAFNRVGIFADVKSKVKVYRNAVFGHLVEKGKTLTNGDYARRDRMVISTGNSVPVWIFPASNLRSQQDINVNPHFVQAGKDYHLRADSPLVIGDDYLGAYAPRKVK